MDKKKIYNFTLKFYVYPNLCSMFSFRQLEHILSKTWTAEAHEYLPSKLAIFRVHMKLKEKL